ncbi:hypothetical protein PFISCL1PPCAC_22906, partial [Pristionchus fissidentatus]
DCCRTFSGLSAVMGRLRLLQLLQLITLAALASSKIHHLALLGDARRNVIITSFGYNALGTFDLNLTQFAVPDAISKLTDSGEVAEKQGVIGFSLSRGSAISAGVNSNPHLCQLQQTDQGFDVVFFIADLPKRRLNVYRSGIGKKLRMCSTHNLCEEEDAEYMKTLTERAEKEKKAEEEHIRARREGNILDTIKKWIPFGGEDGKEYIDFIPLKQIDNQFSTTLSIRFGENQTGKYHFIYHNCYNYHAHGYSDRVAVDLTVEVVEKNVDSYLSAGDVPKPQLYLYVSIMFAFAGVLWISKVCATDRQNVFRVHWLMTVLVFLKALSLFFHGVNFYFVSKYGHQREIWAVVFYVTHLVKGAILFGTIILIGTGYTFFKNFLTERDRKVFMIVLPLQIIDNIAMIIIEESEFGEATFQLWYEMFVFLDMICCFAIFFPIIWSMQLLSEGARTDGKAAFNLEKLRLLRQFYLLVIAYIYSTRIIKYMLQFAMPFNLEWLTAAMVEVSTLLFFIVVGLKFAPAPRNPYLRLSLDGEEDDEAIAVTQPGIFDGITNRAVKEERIVMEDIPGVIAGLDDSSDDESDDGSGTKKLIRPEKTLL